MRKLKLVAMQLMLLLLLPLFTLISAAPKQHVAWTRTEVMDPFGLYILQWRVDQKDIIFTATVNTRGFIGLGFSYRHGRMVGSDLVMAWVDDHTGLPNILVSCNLVISLTDNVSLFSIIVAVTTLRKPPLSSCHCEPLSPQVTVECRNTEWL